MPMPIHMELEGEKQGKIEGGCEMSGREGTILIDGLNHTIEIPTNPQDGQPTGKRVHGPMTIVKEIDKSSPQLYLALRTGEPMTGTLKWFRQSGAVEEHYYTTKLEGAIIVAIEDYFPMVFDEATKAYQHMEKVKFTYRKIIWTHEIEGKESEDDWLAPAA